MKVIKKQGKEYKGKNGKTYHYYNYYLQFDNGLRVCIKTISVDDLKKLDAIAEYER